MSQLDHVAKELKRTIQILPNSIFKCNQSTKGELLLTFHEGALAEEFRLTTDQVKNKPIQSIFIRSLLVQVRPYITRTLLGQTVEFEFEFKERLFHCFAKPVTEQVEGEDVVNEVVGYVTDTTNQKRDRDRLKENEEQLRSLINSIPDFVFLKDGEGRWLETNEKALHFFQLQGVDYKGKNDRELAPYSKDYAEALIACETSDILVWQEKTPIRIEEVITQPDGSVITFDVIKVPIFHENGKRKGLVVIGRDITERKISEAALRKAETMNVVGQLAAGVAHEIRNPLTSLKGFVQLMQMDKNQHHEYLDIMLSEIDRIESIINEFLILAKPQSVTFEETDICTLLNKTVALFSSQAILNNVQIFVEAAPNLPPVFCESNQLKQVFINLLKNATESMPDGGNLHIYAVRNDKKHVKISFIDEGCGIPKDRLEKLGQPFYTTKEKGTGLGLMVSYKIIKDHQGKIEVYSELNKGTRFDIILPLAQMGGYKEE